MTVRRGTRCIGGVAVCQVRQERDRVVHDLARRAALMGSGIPVRPTKPSLFQLETAP